MGEFMNFRKQHNLPKLSSKKSGLSQDFAVPETLEAMSHREALLCDCVFDYFLSKFGKVPDDLVINVNESLSRMPWQRGNIRCLPTGSKMYVRLEKAF